MNKKNILIIGAGVAGKELSVEIQKHFNKLYQIVGFLDDDTKLTNKKINGINVLGAINTLHDSIHKFNIVEVFIAIPSAHGKLIRSVIKNCEKEKIIFKIVPRLLEIVEGKVRLSKVREIEVEDLLGRSIVQSEQLIYRKEFRGKTVLVTGAAGSIGTEICKQILSFNPKKLIAIDFWESGLYELDLELLNIDKRKNYKCIIANIQNFNRLNKIFETTKPEIVFHAAAYKHVPLMQEFPEEAVRNNVFGTQNVIKASIKSKAKKFINISTDKAVEPSNVMGATKLISEKLVSYYNSIGTTKFCSVRFGNVLGSQGSVIPTFKKQIAKGGPVTVTDKKMTRYFMTIPEAVQLVLSASMFVKNGGEVFMLDMGEPMKIDDLAKLMISLSGLKLGIDIKIEYSGIRPGEKIEEKLTNDNESKLKTKNKRVFLVKKRKENFNISEIINKLDKILIDGNKTKILAILKQIAPRLL